MNRPTRQWVNPWVVATERRQSVWRRLTPPQLFVSSFLSFIAFGTIGLKVLPGLYTGEPLGWIDALYTATSAVCITGLVVVNTAEYFTFWGQAFLLLLIQVGGIGMITFTTLIILSLGRRLSLRHEAITRASAMVAPEIDTERLARDVVRFTLGIEAIGIVALYILWLPDFGWGGAVWPAVFHGISAFCNAGFTTLPDSLVDFQGAPGILGVVMLLVLAGGLGFLTMEEIALWKRRRREKRGYRISIHSRLAIVTTFVLLGLGWIGFAAFEWRGVLADMGFVDKLSNAMFMSMMPRSAGFHAVDYAQATDSSNFLSILLMFIGGSPGSAAGGIKVTTFALLALLAWSRFRGRDIVHVAGRSLPEETIQRAVGLALTVFAGVTVSIFIFTFTEGNPTGGATEVHGFLARMFEATSAFNTVGLSMGLTDELSDAGKLLSALLMFVGRVGPLTFAAALALAAHRHRVTYRYAYEDVVVG